MRHLPSRGAKDVLILAGDHLYRVDYGFAFEGYWEDIGAIASYCHASLAMTEPDPPFDFCEPNRPISTRPRFFPPSRIDGCALERTVVAEGGKLYDADLQECIIGLRSMVRPGARLRQVVTMGADLHEDEDCEQEEARMARYGVDTKLSPEQAVARAVAWFGKEGLGLEVTERDDHCATFVGGGGHVRITATVAESKTALKLETREWDYDVKQFVRKIARA
jgi:hypothetical protein